MQLTGPQRRMVCFYRDHRHAPPTVGGFFRRGARLLLLWAACGVAGSYLCTLLDQPALAFLVVGMLAGAALREFRQYLWVVQVWPAVDAILDWQRVEELAGTADDQGRA